MKAIAKLAFGALMLGGAAIAVAAPAAAHTSVGISFGFGGPDYGPAYGPAYGYDDPCAYYDYYDAPPPWGLPPGYCGYQVYYDPVFWGGSWYRGPIYYRSYGGHRQYWLNGGWRHDEWRGRRPAHIEWRSGGHDAWRSGGYGDWRGGTYRRSGGDHFRGGNARGSYHFSGAGYGYGGHHRGRHH